MKRRQCQPPPPLRIRICGNGINFSRPRRRPRRAGKMHGPARIRPQNARPVRFGFAAARRRWHVSIVPATTDIHNSSTWVHRQGVPLLLTVAFVLFATGIFFPFFHVTKFWVFHDAVSVVSGILALFREGEYFLFGVLALFTLVFPCVKLGLLGVIWAEREHNLTRVRRLHRWVEGLGKWSMLDVFVVAILIVAMKSAAVADLRIGAGLYLFTFSVIATQAASAAVARLLAHD